jgi:hypothetical protein
MKVLIQDERSDALEFLLGCIVDHGYKAGIAKECPEINDMLSDERYDVVLSAIKHEDLVSDRLAWIKSSSVFIIGIVGKQKESFEADSVVNLYLQRPFEASKLWQAIYPVKGNLPLSKSVRKRLHPEAGRKIV